MLRHTYRTINNKMEVFINMNIQLKGLRHRLLLGVAATIVSFGTPLTVASTAHAVGDDQNERYYALGDSVAAGYGAGTIANSPYATPCERTTAAYPDVIAAAKHYQERNMACTGATAAAGLNGPQTRNGVTIPSQISQLNTLKKKPELVTITIGANDVHWFDFMAACLGLPTDCDTPENTAAFTAFLNAATPQISAAVQAVKNRSPKRVALTGYYDPFGALATPVFGLTANEVVWYRARIAQLNTALNTIAVSKNVKYVDVMSLDAALGDVILGNPLSTYGFAHPSPAGQTKIANLVRAKFNL